MKILVTAGNTQVRIDKVRCLTNIFTGRTGASIALHAQERGHAVTLLTSHPEAVADGRGNAPPGSEWWQLIRYRTFEDLQTLLEETILSGQFDAVIHSAAVSDYLAAGIYSPAPGTHFKPENRRWGATTPPPTLMDRQAGKVKSDEPELWLRLVRAPKLIDFIRTEWAFHGVLVKFKLEVECSEDALLQVAERSRQHSLADLMVANTLEESNSTAYLGPRGGVYQRLARLELAARLLEAVEQLFEERRHG